MSNLMVAPAPFFTALDANGATINGAKIYTLSAGGVWPGNALATYQDAAGTILNANPIVCDAAGRCVIHALPTSYKFIYCDADDVVIRTDDNVIIPASYDANVDIPGIAAETLPANSVVYLADGSIGTTAGRWYLADADDVASSTDAGVVGMVPALIASGASGSIRLQGRLSGFVGLTPGADYFVSGTAGAITETAPSNRRFIGVADLSTTLVIQPTNNATAAVVSGAIALAGQAQYDLMAASSASQWARVAGAANAVLVTDGSKVPSLGSTLPAAVQANITQAGALTIPSVKITGGAADGYFLRSDADGDATWVALSASQIYKGTWNATTNTPTLTNGSGTAGWYYRCVVAGTVDFGAGNITFAVGDDASYNGTIWERIPGQGYTLQVANNVLGGVLIPTGGNFTINGTTGELSLAAASSRTALSINNVENTALSTWAGSANVVTVGALNAGSITSGFGSINVGADPISGGPISGTTGSFSGAVSASGGFFGNVTGNCSGSSGSCTGNAATSSACSGNAATATYATSAGYATTAGSAPANGGTSAACSGNAATATYATTAGSAPANGGTSAACSGNAATATYATSAGSAPSTWNSIVQTWTDPASFNYTAAADGLMVAINQNNSGGTFSVGGTVRGFVNNEAVGAHAFPLKAGETVNFSQVGGSGLYVYFMTLS